MTKQDQQRAERILEFIRERSAEQGYPPTVREIAEAVGLASTSAVQRHPVSCAHDPGRDRRPLGAGSDHRRDRGR